jgi:hypothetical protein
MTCTAETRPEATITKRILETAVKWRKKRIEGMANRKRWRRRSTGRRRKRWCDD